MLTGEWVLVSCYWVVPMQIIQYPLGYGTDYSLMSNCIVLDWYMNSVGQLIIAALLQLSDFSFEVDLESFNV